jgi:hypothetical protein
MNDSKNTTIVNLLNERQTQYGDTWLLVGKVIELLEPQFMAFVPTAPHAVFNWVIMLSKMIRILFTPENPDHWRDIAGYATLQLDYLTKEKPDEIRSDRTR